MNLESAAIAFLTAHERSNVAVSFSGGKDSLVALDLAVRVGIRKAVFCDTTIEYEETTKYVDEVSKFYGIQVETIRAPVDFYTMIDRMTVPSRRARWCCDVFKFGPLMTWAHQNNITGYITGLRRDESIARYDYKDLDRNPAMHVDQINPILEWSTEDVLSYINKYNLPMNPLYEKFDRVGCWPCPYKSPREWERIEAFYPEKVAELKRHLYSVADRLSIRNRRYFVDGWAWTWWIYPIRKVTMGLYSPCNGSETNVIFAGDSKENVQRVVDLLPAITSDFRRIGSKIRIRIDGLDRRRLNILIEKAINCEGCGACLTLCSKGALYIKDNHVAVSIDDCVGCQECIKTNRLRGACVIRHYTPRRKSLVKTGS